MRISHWIAGLALACAANSGATCVIVVVERDQVILASDGLETHLGAAPAKVCKISAGQQAGVTIVGLARDGNTGFDLPAMARAVLERRGSLHAAIAEFGPEARRKLEAEVDEQRQHASEAYSPRLGRPLARVIFAGIEQGQAVAYFQDYAVGLDGVVEEQRLKRVSGDRIPRMFVFCDAASKYMQNTPELRVLEPAQLAYTLLRHAIDAEPRGAEEVGPPIAILAVRRSGPRWIEGGACGTAMARGKTNQ